MNLIAHRFNYSLINGKWSGFVTILGQRAEDTQEYLVTKMKQPIHIESHSAECEIHEFTDAALQFIYDKHIKNNPKIKKETKVVESKENKVVEVYVCETCGYKANSEHGLKIHKGRAHQ